MKVFANDVIRDRAVTRISKALKKFAPDNFLFVDTKEEADLVVLFINGRHTSFANEIEDLTSQGKGVAAVQISIRSTRNPSTKDWLPIWEKANLIWSYYDLKDLCREDNTPTNFNFYHAPLGVDEVFKEYPTIKEYIIATSGLGYSTESVRECILAADAIGGRVFHVGPRVTNRTNVDFSDGMNDVNLAQKYSACTFVSGLRRKEGFELPVIEGLVCGARPIVFDAPHYRQWFDGLAIFIPEGGRESVVESLTKIFRKNQWPVSEVEIVEAKKRFAWEEIVKGFWERI